jgi:Methyltransferase domain
MLDSLPYIRGLREQVDNVGEYAPGHFYSPTPARNDVVEYLASKRDLTFPELRLNREKQFELLKIFRGFYRDLPFTEAPDPGTRYYYDQTVFCYADAIFLYSFLRHTQPKRIIEVGSGFSSAVTLDTVDRFFPNPPSMTFIEPYPLSLKRLFRDGDADRVRVIEEKVQKVPVDTFAFLRSGDLLFIDSTHVMKCGSDLQFLLFEVLPRLQEGVYVHFHDIFGSFEYPEEWLLQGRYWNENYVLRAFLAYNSAWDIHFFNDYVAVAFEDFIRKEMPLCLKNPGGSLYLRKAETSSTNS